MSEISKYITIIRPEFMAFCKDACRAATLNHLLFRIAGKSKDQPRENIQAGKILWYAKNELIASEMSDAWGVCKVRKEVNELVKMGLFGRKNNPTWGVDRTKHFCFGSEQCEIFLKYCENNGVCVVHLDLPTEVRHLIYSSLANDRTIKCTCEKADLEQANDKSIACIRYNHSMHSINLSPANDKSIEAITKTTTKTSDKDNYEEEGTYSASESENAPSDAHASTPAHSSQDEPYRPDFQANQSRIANTPQGDDFHDHATTDLRSVGRTDRDALRVPHSDSHGTAEYPHRNAPAQRQSGDRTSQAHSAEHAADGGANTRTSMDRAGLTSKDHESTQTSQRFQADATTGVSAGAGGYEKAGSRAGSSRPRSSQRSVTGEEKQSKRTSKSSSEAMKSEPLTMPPEDAPWNTTTCLHLFDFWRGAPLLRKDECMKASHCAKGLAENYTRKQVETVRRWMRERDPYWSQRASSVDVCQVAGQIHRILADIEAARQVKRAASTQAVDPQVAAVRALAQRFSAPVGER